MSGSTFIGVGLGLLLALAFAGCSNDNCVDCPGTTAPLGYAYGSLVLVPEAFTHQFEIHGHGAMAPDLDSIKLGDSLIGPSHWAVGSADGSYAGGYYAVFIQEMGDTSTFMYHHGDTATLTVWGEGRSSTCRLKLLDLDSSRAVITDPPPLGDTIMPGQSVTFSWSPASGADFYAIIIDWGLPFGPSHYYYDSRFYYTTDTFFTVPGSWQPDSLLHFGFHVTPFTGPDPRTGQSNWTGSLLDGVLYSFGITDARMIYLDTVAQSPSRSISPQAAAEETAMTPEQMVARVYEQYREK